MAATIPSGPSAVGLFSCCATLIVSARTLISSFPDPQSLGFARHRLSDIAESTTTDYVEATGYVKLYLLEGETDFVAAPNLTTPEFEFETILGHLVRVDSTST